MGNRPYPLDVSHQNLSPASASSHASEAKVVAVNPSEDVPMWTTLSILCPPVAVLATGQLREAVKTAGLTLLFYVPGVLHARREVESYRVRRQYEPVFLRMGL